MKFPSKWTKVYFRMYLWVLHFPILHPVASNKFYSQTWIWRSLSSVIHKCLYGSLTLCRCYFWFLVLDGTLFIFTIIGSFTYTLLYRKDLKEIFTSTIHTNSVSQSCYKNYRRFNPLYPVGGTYFVQCPYGAEFRVG